MCPQIWPKTVAAIDIHRHRTYVRYMLESGGEDWSWDGYGPLPEPPVDLPDDPEPDDVDALDEVIRLERGRNSLEGHRSLWILQLLRDTPPNGGLTARH